VIEGREPGTGRKGILILKPVPTRLIQSLACAVACALVACSSPPPLDDEHTFVDELQKFRAAKDDVLRQAGSPILPGKQADWLPLSYFSPSLSYRTPAVLRVAGERPEVEMPTSTGQRRRMRRVGVLEFSLKGQTRTLGAFADADDRRFERLFVPFTDLTSGTETYPGGRYLDLDRTPTGLYVVDFNRAYHPYCYYNPEFDCPYPPRENRLQVPVRAGEKLK
jgi:uncharacterized protein